MYAAIAYNIFYYFIPLVVLFFIFVLLDNITYVDLTDYTLAIWLFIAVYDLYEYIVHDILLNETR